MSVVWSGLLACRGALLRAAAGGLLFAAVCLSGCREVGVPKPIGYFRIELPDNEFHRYDDGRKPYMFDYSVLATVVSDRDRGADSTWVNIVYPSFNCKIHVTYLRLNPRNEQQAYDDQHRFVYKHTIKADAITESYYDDVPRRVHATLYDIKGNAATPMQFAITDSLGRFFRGALYFGCRPNKDSLAPVVQYVNRDIERLIETFEWRQP